MKKLNINTVFFDIGNIFFYDYPVKSYFYYIVYLEIKKTIPSLSIKDFFSLAEIPTNKDQWIYSVMKIIFKNKWEYINHISWNKVLSNWNQLMIPIPKNITVFDKIKFKYNIYFVANQPTNIRQILYFYKLNKNINEIYLDQEIGIEKPNQDFFNFVIKRNKLKIDNILMVGDRLDNDIIPAKKIGLKTCLIRTKIPSHDLSFLPKEWNSIYYKNFSINLIKEEINIDIIGDNLDVLL